MFRSPGGVCAAVLAALGLLICAAASAGPPDRLDVRPKNNQLKLSDQQKAEARWERVAIKSNVRIQPRTSGSSLPDSVPDKFTAGGKEFRFTGKSTMRTSLAVPVAILIPPPFEKVVRGYVIPLDQIGFSGPAHLVLLRPGIRSRNVHDDIVPVAIEPQTVSTSFTQGSSSSSSESGNVEVSFGQTIGFKIGGDYAGFGAAAGVAESYEAACGTGKGNATSWSVSATGVLEGYNWTLSCAAKVFAVETNYQEFEFRADGAGLPVTIGVPVEYTAVLFTLDGWNAYAEDMNSDKDILQKLPTYRPDGPWWIGNVDNYPRTAADCMINTSHISSAFTRPVATTQQWFKIDRQGGSLSGSLQISQEDWQSATAGFGTSTQFSFEAKEPGISLSTQIVQTVKQSYTHQLSQGQSFTMSFKTSGAHALLDGGPGSIADFHFKLSPVIFRLGTGPDSKAMRRRQDRQALLTNLVRSAARAGDRVPASVARALKSAKVDDVVIDASKGITVAGYPLAALMYENGLGADGCTNVLVLQYRVGDLGGSFGRISSAAAPLLMAHKAGLLRKAAGAPTGETVSTGTPGNVPIVMGWPPKIALKNSNVVDQAARLNLQLTAWTRQPQYRTGQIHRDLTDWLDSRPQFNAELLKLRREFPKWTAVLDENAARTNQAVDRWKELTLSPAIKDRMLLIEPGFYVLEPDLLALESRGAANATTVRRLSIEIERAAGDVGPAFTGSTWAEPAPTRPSGPN